VKNRYLPQRPPEPPADVASPVAGVHAGPVRVRAEIPPSTEGKRPQARGRLLRANVGTTTAATVLVAVLVSVAGCGAGGGNATEQADSPIGADSPETTTAPEGGSEAAEAGDDGFVASAESSGGEAGAADRIEGVRFQIFDDYERLLIDFGGRDGGAAGVPRWSVESSAEGGYVRVQFPGVTSTAVTDEDFVGSVLDELYVVRDSGGGLFADVFGLHAFRYRVTELPESGRLAVDFRGVREEIGFPPTTGDEAVVLQPREAEEVVSPVAVRGYARPSEGQVTVSLLSRERKILASKTVRADDRAAAWGLFETKLGFSGYEGIATLRVGGRNPRDGSFVGTETEIFLESSGPG
jgi:hypothetical protein